MKYYVIYEKKTQTLDWFKPNGQEKFCEFKTREEAQRMIDYLDLKSRTILECDDEAFFNNLNERRMKDGSKKSC